MARTRAAQRSHAAPKRPTADVLPRLRVNAGYHPLSALALQPVAVAAPVMGAPVAGPQFGTYAAVPMHHRPRNTCCRKCAMFVAPVIFGVIGIGLLPGGSATDPDAYWTGCG